MQDAEECTKDVLTGDEGREVGGEAGGAKGMSVARRWRKREREMRKVKMPMRKTKRQVWRVRCCKVVISLEIKRTDQEKNTTKRLRVNDETKLA